MSMFPGPGAQVYYNEAGEPLGWDYPGQDDGDPGDPYDDGGYDPDECDDEACDDPDCDIHGDPGAPDHKDIEDWEYAHGNPGRPE